MDAPDAASPREDPPYVYAASDLRPRQPREIELCETASHFDWQYTGTFALGLASSVYLNISPLWNSSSAVTRLMGPALVGFTWGGLLSGGYLSLPKCQPTWAQGAPPEGNVRSVVPMAIAITVLAGLTAPFMDYAFVGPVKPYWEVAERSARVFVASGFGMLGALFPHLLPPRTWAARKQIDRMRVEGTLGGAALSYTLRF